LTLRHLCYFVLFLLGSMRASAQPGCPQVTAVTFDGQASGAVTCNEPCIELNATPFSVAATNTYSVGSIPYSPPFAYNLGTVIPINTDDVYSAAINIPFSFCFFGVNYNQLVVGSNGMLTFDMSNASGYCPWNFTASIPSPALETNSIFGVYQDINPATCGNVRWQVLGTAPCRTFILNFNGVCQFSCNSQTTTSQIVLYEATNIIEIYIQNKPICSGWNGGRSLVGILNAAGTLGYAPPGRNTGVWSATNEAWRFTPNSGSSVVAINWFENGTLIGSGPNITVCPTETTTYTASATYSSCGGNNTVSDDIIVISDVDPLDPEATITNAQDLCLSQGQYTLVPVDSGGTWSSDCGACLDANGVFDTSLSGAGNFNVTYEVITSCGPIQETVTFEVTEDPDPTITAVGVLCTSQNAITLQTATAGGVWDAECGLCLNPATGDFFPSISGAGTFWVSYSIDGYCPVTSTINISVADQQDASFSAPTTICENASPVALSPTNVGGVWSASCGSCINSDTGVFNPSTAGDGTHTLIYTFTGNCPDQTNTTIEVINVELPVLATPPNFCDSSDPHVLAATPAGGSWIATCVGCLSGATFDPAIGAGSYTLTYTVGTQCAVSANVVANVQTQQSAIFSVPDTICSAEAPLTFPPADLGGSWNASCGSCINTSTGLFNPQVAGPGAYNITYSIPGLCGDSFQESVVVDFSDVANINPVLEYCEGYGDVQITATQLGGIWSASCGTCIDPSTGIFNTLDAGSGLHQIIYTFGGLCGDSDTRIIEVVDNFDPSITAVNGFCVDAPLQQMFAATPGGFWSATCGTCMTPSGFFAPGEAGVGVHTITYTIPGSCGGVDTEEVSVFGIPNADFAATNFQGCVPFTAGFVQDSVQQVFCQWNFGDGNYGTSVGTAAHTYTGPGCYDVSLTVTSYQGCTATRSYNDIVCGLGLPNAYFIYDPIVPTTDEPIVDFIDESVGGIQYVWTLEGNVQSTIPNPTFNILTANVNPVQVCLQVTNGSGCIDLYCRDIELLENLRVYVPTAFTPDGDGVNEVIIPSVIGASAYEFIVFDRWGGTVFKSNTIGEPWLGNVQGGDYFAPNGAYSYLLKVKGEDQNAYEYSGHIHLLR
jgi:hypothetical protein